MGADKNPVAVQFGKNLRACRESARLSQKELIFHASMYGREIDSLERGEREPHLGEVVRLASALSVSAEDLLEGIEWVPGGHGGGRFELADLAPKSRMTAPDIPPEYDVAAVEALLLEIAAELDPEHLSKEKLWLRVVTNPDDSREVETATRAIRNLQEVGLFKDREDEIVEPTPAALRACALLT